MYTKGSSKQEHSSMFKQNLDALNNIFIDKNAAAQAILSEVKGKMGLKMESLEQANTEIAKKPETFECLLVAACEEVVFLKQMEGNLTTR